MKRYETLIVVCRGHLNQQEKSWNQGFFCVLPTYVPSTDAQDIFCV